MEREENQKNHILHFLSDTWYKDTNEINTKDTKDLVIHLGKSDKDKVGVIIEAKNMARIQLLWSSRLMIWCTSFMGLRRRRGE